VPFKVKKELLGVATPNLIINVYIKGGWECYNSSTLISLALQVT